MASSGMGVWLSLQSSAVVRLFHATSFENLADIDVGPPVLKMLQGFLLYIVHIKFICHCTIKCEFIMIKEIKIPLKFRYALENDPSLLFIMLID